MGFQRKKDCKLAFCQGKVEPNDVFARYQIPLNFAESHFAAPAKAFASSKHNLYVRVFPMRFPEPIGPVIDSFKYIDEYVVSIHLCPSKRQFQSAFQDEHSGRS